MAIQFGKSKQAADSTGASRAGKNEFPSKTYINLVVSEKKAIDFRRILPPIIIAVVVLALFLKFGVFDFYARVHDKELELAQNRNTLSSLTVQLTNYDKVLEEFEGYESLSISSDGLRVNVGDALALVDRYISPVARVASINLNGTTLTLNLTNISLDGIGQLVSTLYEQDIVENVSVANAAQQQTNSEDVTTSMTISLVPLGN